MRLCDLLTPALLLDRTRLERNIEHMRRRSNELGVPLRPHVKTAKCIEVARLALEGQPGGVTVSTLEEAGYFLEHGVSDLLYAVGIAPAKLERIAEFQRRGAEVTIIVDSLEGAEAIGATADRLVASFPVLIEIDCDGHRAGVRPDDPQLVEIGRTLDGHPRTELRGVMTHAGESYSCRTEAAICEMAERERRAVVDGAERLREAALPAPVVSVGSTPTAAFAERLDGVTELRPGTYVFQDLVQVGLGVCTVDDIAISVLTSVIGHQERKDWILIDAGWMALSSDRGTANQEVDQGHGLVCDLEGRPIDDLIVVETNQEHGIVARRDGGALDLSRFPIGSRMRILPNHACATAAQHDGYRVVEGSDAVVAWWQRCSGW